MSNQALPNMSAGRPARRPPAPAPTTAAAGMTAKDVVGILRRRIWMIVIVTTICTGLAGVLWFVLLRTASRYTSHGYIRVKMPGQPDVVGGRPTTFRADVMEAQMITRALYLTNRGFLDRILTRIKVQQTDWFKSYDSVKDRTESLKDNFAATPQRNSQYVAVSMTCASAKEAQLILQEILDQFQQDIDAEANEELRNQAAALRKQRQDEESDVTMARQNLLEMQGQANAPGWGQHGNVDFETLSTLGAEKLQLEREVKQLEVLRGDALRAQSQGRAAPSVQGQITADPLVRALTRQISNLTEQRERLLDRLGAEHSQVREVQRSIDSTEELLVSHQNGLITSYMGTHIEQVEQGLNQTELDLREITDSYAAAAQKQSGLDTLAAKYAQGQAHAELLDKRLARTEERLRDIELMSNNPDRVRAVVDARADFPLAISFPKLSSFLPAGIFVGLVVSCGLAFLIEFLDDSIKTPADVGRHLHIPLLGMVPLHEDGEEDADGRRVEVVAHHSSRSVVSEYYRQVRTNLQLSAPEGELKVILVTSCSGGCGKTTTAANLAITFAADGQQVLLIDGNFRQPAVTGLFESTDSDIGLSNVLIGKCRAQEAIRSSGLENLDVMDSGPQPPNPSYLFNGKSMRDLLADQRQKYDFVIIDGPAALMVTDARVLASVVDGTIVVVRAGETARGVANRMVREMKSPNVRILGALLNGVRPRRGGYLAENFRRYYDYIGQTAYDHVGQGATEEIRPRGELTPTPQPGADSEST